MTAYVNNQIQHPSIITPDINTIGPPALPVFYLRPLSAVIKINDKYVKLLRNLNIISTFDLLTHLPVDFIQRTFIQNLASHLDGAVITCIATVQRHEPNYKRRNPYQIIVHIAGDTLFLKYFNGSAPYLKKILVEQSRVVISGKLTYQSGVATITHPDYVGPEDSSDKWCGHFPCYPLTAGITQGMLSRWISTVLTMAPAIDEWIPAKILSEHHWESFIDSLKAIHRGHNQPGVSAPIQVSGPSRQRLAFEELLLHQLALDQLRDHGAAGRCQSFISTKKLIQPFFDILNFDLTPDQQRAIKDIENDMAGSTAMMRLLQGDVGSGKTVVAFIAALIAVENKHQVALLAPTEILVQQHYDTIHAWCTKLGIKCCILTGKLTSAIARQTNQAIACGDIDIIIGTHALFQEKISYHNLGLIIIDEQHRFGVMQRQSLAEKGHGVHVLMMTATPIPRTLMLATMRNLDTSIIRQKPAGRQDPITSVMPLKKIKEVIQHIGGVLPNNQKVYWICPLVNASEKLDLAAATDRYERLAQVFPNQVGLIHGKLKPIDKKQVMDSFLKGQLKILVATTVIEVGVNDPNATIMVIEHAERFGLAQLHQLRGRIGRGEKKAYCILLYQYPLSEMTIARLNIMRQTTDGFEISEADWRLRGGGDVIGIKQSGLPSYRFVDLTQDEELLVLATRIVDSYKIDRTNVTAYYQLFNIKTDLRSDQL